MMEEFLYRPLKRFPWYLACADGYLINADNGNIIRGCVKKTGYVEVCILDENGDPHSALLHRLIAETFCEKKNETDEVNHIDGNKTNNSASNLEWISHEENLKHAYTSGLRDDDVSPKKVIAQNIETGEKMEFPSIYKAARFLGISQGNICMCCKGLRPYANGYEWRYAE